MRQKIKLDHEMIRTGRTLKCTFALNLSAAEASFKQKFKMFTF